MGDLLAELGGWATLTPSAVVLVAILLIFRGKLVPSRYYDEVKADRDKWRTISEKESAANQVLLQQNGELIKAGITTQKVLKAIPREAGGS